MKKNNSNPQADKIDYLSNSASQTDCTGLIPHLPLTRAEKEFYDEMYHYIPIPPNKQDAE